MLAVIGMAIGATSPIVDCAESKCTRIKMPRGKSVFSKKTSINTKEPDGMQQIYELNRRKQRAPKPFVIYMKPGQFIENFIENIKFVEGDAVRETWSRRPDGKWVDSVSNRTGRLVDGKFVYDDEKSIEEID
jgi:hypothetical protein